MSRLRSVGVVGAAAVTVAGTAAACATPLAKWEMNERPNLGKTTVMINSVGNGLNGTVGSKVKTGSVQNGRVFYSFLNLTGTTQDPNRIVRVNDDRRLNPDTATFVVTLTMRTVKADGNLVQKGQATGPFFKLENHLGKTTCLFRGSGGSSGVGSVRTTTNGQWHTIRCERTATSVTMKVDGIPTGTNHNPTGSIANTSPLTIGGKANCSTVVGGPVGCDFFVGDMDRVEIDKG
jgi:hypothetical protein